MAVPACPGREVGSPLEGGTAFALMQVWTTHVLRLNERDIVMLHSRSVQTT